VVLRLNTNIEIRPELLLAIFESVGVKVACTWCLPVTEGFQLQVAIRFGAVPVVEIETQLGILLPSKKNLTFPEALTVTVTDSRIPLVNSPE
jgi:hypothetical protein